MRSTSRSGTRSRSASASTARSARATCARISPTSRRIAECYVTSYPNAGLPNAFGEYDEHPAKPRRCCATSPPAASSTSLGGCCGTTPDHIAADRRGRSRAWPPGRCRHRATWRPPLRHPSGAELRIPDPRPARTSGSTQFSGLEPLTIRPDSNFQMIGERTNVTGSAQVRPADQVGQLRRGGRRRARAGPRRRQHHRRQHGRRHARFRAGDDDVPELHRDRAGDRARAGDDRQLEVDGARGRAQVRPGQGRRQFDQPEGRRGRLPRSKARLVHRYGAGGRRHGLRRDRPGRHGRAQSRRSASGPTSC